MEDDQVDSPQLFFPSLFVACFTLLAPTPLGEGKLPHTHACLPLPLPFCRGLVLHAHTHAIDPLLSSLYASLLPKPLSLRRLSVSLLLSCSYRHVLFLGTSWPCLILYPLTLPPAVLLHTHYTWFLQLHAWLLARVTLPCAFLLHSMLSPYRIHSLL